MRPHPVERGQALAGDGTGDLAFAHAVAATDLCLIGQGCNGRHRVQGGAPLIGLAKDQRVAHGACIDAPPEHVEEPGAVGSLAIEHRADDAVVLEDEALVDAGRGIAQHDLLAILGLTKIARREQVDAGHLELGRGDRPLIGGLLPGQGLGQHLTHFIERCDKAIAGATMLRTFAQGEDMRVIGTHLVVDHDAAVDGQPGSLGEAGGGADADRHHHHFAGNDRTVAQFDAFDPVVAKHLFRIGLCDDADAAILERLFQQVAGSWIELALHQRRLEMQHGDIHAAHLQSCRSFQTQQAAADDDDPCAAPHRQHLVHVIKVPVGHHAWELMAWNRGDEGGRARGNDQLVVVCDDPVGGNDLPGVAVDQRDRGRLVQRDAILRVPVITMRDDLFVGLFAGQDWRKHQPVVVHARLGVENGDGVAIRRCFEEIFEHAAGRHAIAYDHEFFAQSAVSCLQGKTKSCQSTDRPA